MAVAVLAQYETPGFGLTVVPARGEIGSDRTQLSTKLDLVSLRQDRVMRVTAVNPAG